MKLKSKALPKRSVKSRIFDLIILILKYEKIKLVELHAQLKLN